MFDVHEDEGTARVMVIVVGKERVKFKFWMRLLAFPCILILLVKV